MENYHHSPPVSIIKLLEYECDFIIENVKIDSSQKFLWVYLSRDEFSLSTNHFKIISDFKPFNSMEIHDGQIVLLFDKVEI